ncbi:MAG TPA: Mur ligase domain-containing protein, partial [Arthrobacter sp.]|nr:Mur ligase domain-containing protein [Arthrobacter sp.]
MKATDFHTTARLPFDELGAVHFIGLGGAGMSAIARILLARGVPVSGSDARDSAVLRQLEALGATVFVGHEADHVGGA